LKPLLGVEFFRSSVSFTFSVSFFMFPDSLIPGPSLCQTRKSTWLCAAFCTFLPSLLVLSRVQRLGFERVRGQPTPWAWSVLPANREFHPAQASRL
jgi:hypothetical protein